MRLRIPLMMMTIVMMMLFFVACEQTDDDDDTMGDDDDTTDDDDDDDNTTDDDDDRVDDDDDVDAQLALDLQYLHEEEKLARDVYLTLYDAWGLSQHQNIAASEQTHMDQVKSLLATLEIEDPVQDETVGVFVNGELETLYGDLVQTGTESELAALRVGAIIEDLDIEDIEAMKANTSLTMALDMYEALQCGSRNHLRSYVSALDRAGENYTPQYISQEEYDEIIGSPNETCNP